MDDINKVIGQNLADLRKSSHLTLAQISEEIGVTHSYLSKLEAGKIKKPSFENLNAIADYFNVDLSYFATEKAELNKMSEEERDLVFSKKLSLDVIEKADIIDSNGNKITKDEREFMLNALKNYRESKAKFLESTSTEEE
ncbi:helix-turn-helix domain-containing protein [Bacillus pumilus]|uniref:XRE family transcriptional regulator n=1 Tax=Bacillus pumilus TaxID=1408 RepID=A0AAD0HP72_BACPU|nr:helix-turn-helix transcriptional regulator [Bacillus pumilus]AVM24924.1 XRE family transcriptional regulator [Bacillus pumilus]TYS42028.1 helix-turn-helix transcriptional regulator [Bacillus pumilus]